MASTPTTKGLVDHLAHECRVRLLSAALRGGKAVQGILRSLSGSGLIVASLFMAASLTPSLVPRPAVVQGVLCGLSLCAGYALDSLVRWVWVHLHMPRMPAWLRRALLVPSGVVAATLVVAGLWLALSWQNEIRQFMGLAPEPSGQMLLILGIALLVAVAVLAVARLFLWVAALIEARANRLLSRRLAWILGVVSASLLFWHLGTGLLIARAMEGLDRAYARVDAAIQDDLLSPVNPLKVGSPQSLIDWQSIGHQGRVMVSAWPAAEDIMAITQQPALQPLRVYVGLNSAPDVEARVALALEELQRIGAFDRALLVIATPTGTGWMDPRSLAPLELLYGGDVATVSVQYSYVPSWMSVLVAPEYGEETAAEVFRQIYGYWTSLPRERRPKLYLFGMSLGALHSSDAADLLDVIGDPFQGALWVGPPFSSRAWRQVLAARDPQSPVWDPVIQGSRVIRFANRDHGFIRHPEDFAAWGPLRIGYLVYGGDPVTFFTPNSAWRMPDWLKEPRSPELPPRMRWYPVVTSLQGLLDIGIAGLTPVGFGHMYSAEHYLRAWVELTGPHPEREALIERVRDALRERPL